VEAYLNAVLRQLYAHPLREGSHLSVKVIVDPTLNAFALPNGALYIHTGMLARLENEAQLAAVLSHEVTHAIHRHGLKNYRNIKNQSAVLAAFTVSTGGLGALLGGVGMMASVSGYSQDLEREADAVGFKMMVECGYDPRESSKVFRTLLAESKRSKIKEPFFFGSHPKLAERIASYDQLVGALPPSQRQGRTEAAAYTEILPRVLLGNSEAASRVRDFDFAQTCAERCLLLQPDNGDARFQLAEVFRRRDGESDAATALRHYRELVSRDPNFATAYRGMGLTSMKLGDKAAAAAAFERYLLLLPAAEDRAYIQIYLDQCQTKS
jgi:predicted Zn-dependent protease